MREFSNQKVLIVKKSLNDPLYPSIPKDWPGGQQEQGPGVVLHGSAEGYQEPKTFRSGSSQVTQGVNDMSKVQIPNWDHCI